VTDSEVNRNSLSERSLIGLVDLLQGSWAGGTAPCGGRLGEKVAEVYAARGAFGAGCAWPRSTKSMIRGNPLHPVAGAAGDSPGSRRKSAGHAGARVDLDREGAAGARRSGSCRSASGRCWPAAATRAEQGGWRGLDALGEEAVQLRRRYPARPCGRRARSPRSAGVRRGVRSWRSPVRHPRAQPAASRRRGARPLVARDPPRGSGGVSPKRSHLLSTIAGRAAGLHGELGDAQGPGEVTPSLASQDDQRPRPLARRRAASESVV